MNQEKSQFQRFKEDIKKRRDSKYYKSESESFIQNIESINSHRELHKGIDMLTDRQIQTILNDFRENEREKAIERRREEIAEQLRQERLRMRNSRTDIDIHVGDNSDGKLLNYTRKTIDRNGRVITEKL